MRILVTVALALVATVAGQAVVPAVMQGGQLLPPPGNPAQYAPVQPLTPLFNAALDGGYFGYNNNPYPYPYDPRFFPQPQNPYLHPAAAVYGNFLPPPPPLAYQTPNPYFQQVAYPQQLPPFLPQQLQQFPPRVPNQLAGPVPNPNFPPQFQPQPQPQPPQQQRPFSDAAAVSFTNFQVHRPAAQPAKPALTGAGQGVNGVSKPVNTPYVAPNNANTANQNYGSAFGKYVSTVNGVAAVAGQTTAGTVPLQSPAGNQKTGTK